MITVEDVNTYIGKYGIINSYYEIDTSLISNNGLSEYEDVLYDFVKITHTVEGSTHSYSFEIHNNGWTGNFYMLDNNGEYIQDATYTFDDNSLTYTSTHPNVKLGLQLCNIYEEFQLNYIESRLITPNVSYNIHPEMYEFESLTDGSITSVSADDSWIQELDLNVYVVRFTKKLEYDIQSDLANITLTGGMYHEIPLTVDNVTLEVSYLDKKEIINVEDNPTLIIDLRGMYDLNSLNVTIKIFGNSKFKEDTLNITLPISAIQVRTFSELWPLLNNGVGSIEIMQDMSLRKNRFEDIHIQSDIILKGSEDYQPTPQPYDPPRPIINFNECKMIIYEGATVILENLILKGGDPAIIQSKNTNLIIKNCIFVNNKNSSKNGMGAVIDCDIDINSLSVTDDFVTSITDSLFIDNHSCILHGGQLTVSNCKYHNVGSDYGADYVNVNNPAFLFQVDGAASVTDSVFDLTHDTNRFNNKNVMYGQALFMIGEDAVINDMTHNDIIEDDRVNWCNAPYNNASHLFMKYYYPILDEIVYSSPKHGFEDKNLAYCASGVDWVFKSNTMITRATDHIENRDTKIRW